ncbi:MAG: hypothetical protein GEV28_11555 [Actinophytocola sp.]|uniref:hypothetical protein n=1 Tax=Actinophytocola sp. TaxID=1872138 RepID=UPI0013255A7D|nr:hypothetical protein [Actinophytocola sp.]MPZ80991.1 hypothetical protein [Actinophytocola sp.]
MRGRVRGAAAAAALVLAVCATGLVSGGTASAAEPIVVGDCSTTVQGTPGQPLALSPSAVLAPVLNVVRAVPILGPGLVGAVSTQVSKMGNIPLGTLPATDTSVSGSQIASAALPRIQAAIKSIPLIGGVLAQILGGVQSALTSGCGIVVDVANTVAAPVQDGTDAVADASEKAVAGIIPGGSTGLGPGNPGGETPGGQTPGTGGGPNTGMPGPNQPPLGGYQPGGWSLYEPGLWNFGRSPMADYGSIPFARPGLFAPSPGVRYGGSVPGYTPQFGILGTDNPGDGVQAAGRAEALTPPEGQKIAFPVLLAVLALSMVTAALVRTWVLRRTPAAAL